jgi:hypothetical protein
VSKIENQNGLQIQIWKAEQRQFQIHTTLKALTAYLWTYKRWNVPRLFPDIPDIREALGTFSTVQRACAPTDALLQESTERGRKVKIKNKQKKTIKTKQQLNNN